LAISQLRGRAEASLHICSARNAVNEYRAKGFECLSLAEWMNDPVERAELLRFARIWMNLAEPTDELRGAYELPHRR
jgi:hypothetical protein